jgi:hypothetical protein
MKSVLEWSRLLFEGKVIVTMKGLIEMEFDWEKGGKSSWAGKSMVCQRESEKNIAGFQSVESQTFPSILRRRSRFQFCEHLQILVEMAE